MSRSAGRRRASGPGSVAWSSQAPQCTTRPRPLARRNGAPQRRANAQSTASRRGSVAARHSGAAAQRRATLERHAVQLRECAAAPCAYHEDPLVLAQHEVLRGAHGVRGRARSGARRGMPWRLRLRPHLRNGTFCEYDGPRAPLAKEIALICGGGAQTIYSFAQRVQCAAQLAPSIRTSPTWRHRATTPRPTDVQPCAHAASALATA